MARPAKRVADRVDTLWRRFYSAAMPRPARVIAAALLVVFGLTLGCESSHRIPQDPMFGPAKVRLHPTFTQVKDWNGDGKADGVEAVVEFLDESDEPTKGSGKLLFDLAHYRKADPQPAGERLSDSQAFKIESKEEQAAHWSAALRAYTFRLPAAKINFGTTYVIDVTFETPGGANRPGGGRLFDRLILEPAPEKKFLDRNIKRSGSGKRTGD